MRVVLAIFVLLVLTGGLILAAVETSHVKLRYGQEKTIPGSRFKVKFVRMITDYRCTTGPICRSEGAARIQISLRRGSEAPTKIEIATDQTLFFEGFEIRLASLTPYPSANSIVNVTEYSATLTFTEDHLTASTPFIRERVTPTFPATSVFDDRSNVVDLDCRPARNL